MAVRLYRNIIYCVLFIVCQLVSSQVDIQPAAQHTKEYLPYLKNKNVAIVGNHTSLINQTHLVDTLLKLKVNLKIIFAPEHGFRGIADAGEKLSNHIDTQSGLPIISLYGKNYKPKPEQLKEVDVVLFDVQDVGVRFYTYISTLHYVMEACAENDKQLIVLDRPNPNGFYVDGPVLDTNFRSFVGMHTVPVVYGMTIGEYAMMINGEGWLRKKIKCNLKVIKCLNYTHNSLYKLPVKPSPNLPNMASIYLYPSLCFFEGTDISVGRGTPLPFQIYGHPELKNTSYSFTPASTPGASKYPPHENILCRGHFVGYLPETGFWNNSQLHLSWLINAYDNYPDQKTFFNNFFNLLAGSAIFQEQIVNGISEKEIRESWQSELVDFMLIRKKYLLYEDFH